MSKLCNNCGSAMADDSVFCPNCGAQEQPAPQSQATFDPFGYSEQPAYIPEETSNEGGEKKPLSGLLDNMKMLIAGVAGVVVVVLLAVLLFSGGWKTAIKTYESAINGNAGKFIAMAPNAYWKWAKEEGEVTKADAKKEYKDQYKDMKEEMEEELGKNAKAKIKITDKDKMSKKDLKEVGKALEDRYDIDDKKVKAGWEVEVEITYKGKEDDVEIETTMKVVKISGKWYVIMGNSFYCDSVVSEIWED